MEYHDIVYGSQTIEEPVLLALMDAPALHRLHGVLQHGITALIGITHPVTRFDHSVGVMLLARGLGASLPEQIAALLHDVSHTAFSHVIDYVFQGHNSQSYHDDVKDAYIAMTGLPDLLAEYGFHWRHFLDETNFSLLEQPSPRLCADRLDYFLRDSLDLGLSSPADVQRALDHLVVHDGRIVTDDVQTARWLADTYLAADDASWANFREVGLYELAARAIRRALEIGVIGRDDLWKTDRVVWETLHDAPDPALQRTLALVSPETRFEWDEANPTFRVSTKLRTLDPDVLLPSGALRPLSALDADYARRRQRYLHRKEGKWPVRVVPPAGLETKTNTDA